MKRALAQRAKQQNKAADFMQQQQQQNHHVGGTSSGSVGGGSTSGSGNNNVVGTPSTLSSMSTLGSGSVGTNHSSACVSSPPSMMQKQQMMRQEQQQQESNRVHHHQQQQQQQQRRHPQEESMRVEITSQPPPRKIPRIKSSPSPRTPPNSVKSSNSTISTTSAKKNKMNGSRNKGGGGTTGNVKSSGVSSSNPKKRSRPSSGEGEGGTSSSTAHKHPSALRSPLPLPTIEDDDEEENDSKNTRFYLKHQNSALASELYRYKHAIRVLEQERKVRRDECRHINDALRDMVSYWDGMESILFATFGGNTTSDGLSKSLPKSLASLGPATSSGKGMDVEHVYNIMESILKLSKSSAKFESEAEMMPIEEENSSHIPDNVGSTENENDFYQSDSTMEQKYLKHLSRATSSFSSRVTNFQRLLVNLIQHYINQYTNGGNNSSGSKQTKQFMNQVIELGTLKQQLSELQNKYADLEGQMEDVSKDRDIAKDNERRVRRGLYRVSTGREKITEALQAVEESSSLGIKDLEELQKDLLSSSKHQSNIKGENGAADNQGVSSGGSNLESRAITIDGKTLGIDDVMEMKKQIEDLGLVNDEKEKKYLELLTEKENLELKINSLLDQATKRATLKEEDVKSSSLYVETSSKLVVAEKEKEKLQDDLNSVNERWARTKGDLEQYRKTIEDIEEKHRRRLKELSGEMEDGPDGEAMKEELNHAKRAVLLEHKLKHALDNVRQAENMKSSLIDAITMKESLLRQINELKTRNEELENSQESYRNNLLESDSTSDPDNAASDKIQRLKKELGTALQSNDQAKRNLEQFGNERESLMMMNTRLQQQSMEKDDMNAKSLSTILHLKQLSEQLEQEKGILEKRLKSTEQLAVMARLASNAKEKVEREAIHEKEIAEEESKRIKSSYEELMKQNNVMQTELNLAKSYVEKTENDLQSLTDRCNELVSSSTMKQKEIKRLSEDLVVSKKAAVEAIQKASAATASSSSNKFDSGFTAEQLTIQVNQLKGRLTCPVCGIREKNVIITRCGHMFCKRCIALNLENRNRKCPTCGIRFDKKDIENIYF